jgi:hypothetical protein
LAQNLLPSGISALQDGQSIDELRDAKSRAHYDKKMLSTTVAEQVLPEGGFGDLGVRFRLP